MFIERFFNPTISPSRYDNILYTLKDALDHCRQNYSFIRHHNFKSDMYIKFDGNNFVWRDGSKVNLRKLPRKGNYGKYISELYNFQSF